MLDFTGPKYVLFYEDLQDNLLSELQSVFRFLRFNVSTNALECAVKNSEGNHHRQKRIVRIIDNRALTLEDIYTEKMIAKINKTSAEIRNIIQMSYGKIWNHNMLHNKVL